MYKNTFMISSNKLIRSFSRITFVTIAICSVIFLSSFTVKAESAQQTTMLVAGWVENATLFPDRVTLKAKLDTGAQTTSINAENLVHFLRNKKNWVRFSLTNYLDQTVTVEEEVIRIAKIKRHFGKSQERPVIRLDICIGSIRKKVEVSLVDRSGLNYQLLIGRNFLENGILIDSSKSFKLKSGCSELEQ